MRVCKVMGGIMEKILLSLHFYREINKVKISFLCLSNYDGIQSLAYASQTSNI